MVVGDESTNRVQEVTSEIAEKTGDVIGDKSLRAFGKSDKAQAKANLRRAGDIIKETFGV
jgi:uncharacterized protein YjbJ (UPF0337 family)